MAKRRILPKSLRGLTDSLPPWGQSLVEFALVLPLLLLFLFVIVELARVLHAWLAIENGARFGVRYAVTGEYDPAYCSGYPGGVCDDLWEVDAARLASINDAARSGAVGILRDDTVTTDGVAKFFKVTVCSSSAVYTEPDPSVPRSAACSPGETPGGPGERVVVSVDFDHPLITPIMSVWWPQLRLTASREGIVEIFRTSRLVAAPPAFVSPTWTPSATSTPSSTATASSTPTSSTTPTPSNTPTASNTPTSTSTPTVTPTPSCSGVTFGSFYTDGNGIIRQYINNTTYPGLQVTGITVSWPALESASNLYGWNEYVDWMRWDGRTVNYGNDYSSSTSSNTGMPRSADLGSHRIRMDWDGGYGGDFSNSPLNLGAAHFGFSVSFNDSNCNLSRGASGAVFPTPTFTLTPSNTAPPTNTSPPTLTFTPSRTPTNSRTPTRTLTPSNTAPPTNTLPPTATSIPSWTPTASVTPTASEIPTATPTIPFDG